ncbi:MAG: MFS transporter, partial [Chloroflexota bacterium]
KKLMVIGCFLFGIGLIIQGGAPFFIFFVLGATLQAPASGIFVNLAQASLMDHQPKRRENNMALWTFSGSLAVVVGPLLLSGMLLLGQDWRFFFVSAGFISIIISIFLTRRRLESDTENDSAEDDADSSKQTLKKNLKIASTLLKKGAVWRWLALLQISDLMLDVLFGLLALYMVDIVGVTQTQAGLAIATWTGVGLLGDFLLLPLLEKVRGLTYLRISSVITLLLYPTFLMLPGFESKLIALAFLGLFNAGWYSILQGKLYDTLGEHSGSILIIGNVTGVIGALIPLGLGIVASQFGLVSAMWLLVISPITLALSLFLIRS